MTDARPEALRRLDPLFGHRRVTADAASSAGHGDVRFDWLDDVFLVGRSSIAVPTTAACTGSTG